VSKLDQLREEAQLLKFRLRMARDKEILLLTQIILLKQELEDTKRQLEQK
jgi:hypothetical protein